MKRLFVILIALLIPLFLVLASCRSVIFDFRFYENEFVKNKVDVKNKEKIAEDLIFYLKHRSAEESYISEFSSAEKSHLLDVKLLMQKGLLLFYGLLVALFLLFAFLLRKRSYRETGIALISGGILAFLVVIILALCSRNFDLAFTRFHELFFLGNWQFPQNALLARLFPEQFFADAFRRVLLNILICGGVLIVLGVMLLKCKKIRPRNIFNSIKLLLIYNV